ncbi:MAG TPA: hypothetical protein VH369_22290 [Bryobacteraceae bacterium]|jgi:hypothetical protein
MNRLLNLLVGAGNVLCLFPQTSRIDYTKLMVRPRFYDSVASALEADWRNVGIDIQTAIEQYERQAAEEAKR